MTAMDAITCSMFLKFSEIKCFLCFDVRAKKGL